MYSTYDSDKIIIMSRDECGEEFNVKTYRIPYAQGELCDAELEAMITIYVDRAAAELNPEVSKPWAETSYRTREDMEREQEEEEQELAEIMADCECDEGEAWDILRQNRAAEWQW